MRWVLVLMLALLASAGGAVAWLRHQGAQVAHLETKAATAEQQTAVANLNTQGVRQSDQRVKITLDTQTSAQALAAKYRAEAQAAGDAHEALDPDRAQRLRVGDASLCRLAPDLDGCPQGGHAGDGAAPVFDLSAPR